MKILQIGCGGIGSRLAEVLYRNTNMEQLPEVGIDLADFDSVELKNLEQGQVFDKADLMKNKAQVLVKRYGFNKAIKKKITSKDLKGYDLIVLCVDNNPTRQEVFEFCHTHKKDYLDLRSDGRIIVAIPKLETLQEALDTLDMRDTQSGSCQKQCDLEKGIIHNSPGIVANIGMQLILNYVRGERIKRKTVLVI